jgi:hypothetical protein
MRIRQFCGRQSDLTTSDATRGSLGYGSTPSASASASNKFRAVPVPGAGVHSGERSRFQGRQAGQHRFRLVGVRVEIHLAAKDLARPENIALEKGRMVGATIGEKVSAQQGSGRYSIIRPASQPCGRSGVSSHCSRNLPVCRISPSPRGCGPHDRQCRLLTASQEGGRIRGLRVEPPRGTD